MPQKIEKTFSLILCPFTVLWNLLTTTVIITGRLLAVVLGLALMIIGIGMTVTQVSIPIGIPMAILGFILTLRGVF